MKIALRRLLIRPNRRKTVFEVEEELRFHIEMLERKYAQQGMPGAHAKAAALKRLEISNESGSSAWSSGAGIVFCDASSTQRQFLLHLRVLPFTS